MTISKNLADDFGLDEDAPDNFDAFDDCRDFCRLQTEAIELTIPAGEFNSSHPAPFDGVGIAAPLIVNGPGALLTGGGALFFLSGLSGFSQKPARTARLFTVPPGTSAFCKTAAQASRFTVGQYVGIGAQEWQGSSGYPPNLQQVEYVRVLSTNTMTGEVTFTPAVRQTYYEHFIDTHTPGEDYDSGGPATMFVMRDPENATGGVTFGWPSDVTINGLSFETDSNQIYCRGLRFVANDVTCTDCCPIPTNGKYIRFAGLTVTGEQMEIDKNIDLLELEDCNLRAIDMQSPCANRAVFRNVNCTEFWHGTGKNSEIYGGSAPGITIGCNGYGGTERVIIDGFDHQGFGIDWVSSQRHDAADFSLVGNVLTYTGGGVLNFGAERTALFLAGKMSSNFLHVGLGQRLGSVVDSGDGHPEHTVSLTTLAPDFLDDGQTVYVVQHPCVDATIRNVANCPQSGGPARQPLFSYGKTPASAFETQGGFPIWGELIYISVDVQRAYTGAQTNCRLHLGGANTNCPVIHVDGTAGFDFDFTINCKIAGERIIRPSSITGGKSGDTSTPPGRIRFMDDIRPKVNDDISGSTSLQKPLIVVTVETSQFVRSFVCNFV